MTFRDEARRLFQDFAAYHNPNETQTEQDLIRPLLQLLGLTRRPPPANLQRRRRPSPTCPSSPTLEWRRRRRCVSLKTLATETPSRPSRSSSWTVSSRSRSSSSAAARGEEDENSDLALLVVRPVAQAASSPSPRIAVTRPSRRTTLPRQPHPPRHRRPLPPPLRPPHSLARHLLQVPPGPQLHAQPHAGRLGSPLQPPRGLNRRE